MKTATIKRYIALAVTVISLVVGKPIVLKNAIPDKSDPPEIAQPKLNYQYKNWVMLSWPIPERPVDFYQMKMIVQHVPNVYNMISRMSLAYLLSLYGRYTEVFSYKLDDNYHHFQVADCTNDANDVKRTSFLVRAGNYNMQDVTEPPFYGPWSSAVYIECDVAGDAVTLLLQVGIWMTIIMVALYTISFMFNVWRKYRAMSDVQIVLPGCNTRDENDSTGLVEVVTTDDEDEGIYIPYENVEEQDNSKNNALIF